MKIVTMSVTAAAFAAALVGAAGCQSGGCGGQNMNTNTPAAGTTLQCGQGTYLNGNHQCVPIPTSSTSNSNTTTSPTTTPVSSH